MTIHGWIIFWFVAGMVFLVLGVISAIKHEDVQAMACMAYSVACSARCECKILQERIEKLEK